jgi:hypothetical protein
MPERVRVWLPERLRPCGYIRILGTGLDSRSERSQVVGPLCPGFPLRPIGLTCIFHTASNTVYIPNAQEIQDITDTTCTFQHIAPCYTDNVSSNAPIPVTRTCPP